MDTCIRYIRPGAPRGAGEVLAEERDPRECRGENQYVRECQQDKWLCPGCQREIAVEAIFNVVAPRYDISAAATLSVEFFLVEQQFGEETESCYQNGKRNDGKIRSYVRSSS